MHRYAVYIAATLLFTLGISCTGYASDSIAVTLPDTAVVAAQDTSAVAQLTRLLQAEKDTVEVASPDTAEISAEILRADSIAVANALKDAKRAERRHKLITRIPDPDMAAWIAALFPGLGQAYNRQYWKIPIIYAGAMGLGYAVIWNNQMYVDYRKGYTDITSGNPEATFYEKLLPSGTTIDSSNRDYYTRIFKNRMETYQRNRDLSIMGMAVLYILSIIDSYVDSQLRDYDVSPDLSMKVMPTVIPATQDRALDNSLGVSCKLKF